MDNSGDNRKAVYDYLKAYTNYKDDYDTFNKSFDESDKMRRVYYDKVKETGGYEGSYDEFLNKLGVNNGSAGSVAQQVIDEYDASMRNAKPVNPTTTKPTNDGSQFAQALQALDWRSDETKLLDEIATSGKATVETLDGEERYPTKPIEVRYDESVQDARNQAVNHKNDAANQLNSLYEEIEKQVDAIPRRVPRSYEAMAGLTEQQLEENRLRAAKRLVEDAKEVIEEAGRKGKTNFIAGLGRGIADKIADPENWDFGITDLADNKYLLDALKKSDKGEELTPAEDKLLQAATTSMAVNYYYSQDLGRGYKAGKTTAESIPFMLEFMINPISQSGSGIAKSLLKYGMKKFRAKAVNRGVTRAAGRLIGDASAAAGMTATTGAANTLASAYEKHVGNYDYRYDDNGNVIVQKTGDMGEGEALARGFLSTFLENQSEMVFGAFAGAGKSLSGIIPSISKLSDNGLVRFYNSIKNAPLAKKLRERVKIGGVVEEYAEEVYNNLANVALGEMTAEDALSVDTNIDTFLGLVPTQLAFSAIGLGGLARENMAAKRRLQTFEERLTDEEKSLFSQLQEAVRSGDNNVARDYIKATLADNSLTEQEKKERIFAAKDMVAAQQAEEIGQEQTQEEQEADAAYTEGVSADPSTYYERYKASRTAASALEQADANLYETINRYVEDDASAGEVENLLSGLEGETEQLARNYLNSLMQLKGAEDAQMQAAVEAVDVFDKSVSPYLYQNADGTRSITTGTYKGRPVYVLPGEGGNVVVAYEDGVKEIALSKDVENQSTSDYDEFIDNYSRDYLTSKEQEFRQKLENHPKTQEPAPGLVLHNGDMTYIVTDVSEDGYVDIVPAYYDPESGRNYAKENSSIQTISRETAMMLQNDYYNAIDDTPESPVQTGNGNILSENQAENESGSSGGESNVSEERQEDTPEQRLANLVASLPKKGNTGELDYNAMTPQQRYEYTSLTESPETAAQDLQSDIKAKQKELDDMQKKLDNSVGGKRTELRDKMRKVRSELSELTDYYQSIATEDQTGSQRQPEGYSANTREVVSEYMNDVQNEEDYLEWVAEESEDALEVASAYNLAKEMASRELKLNPWQQELLGTHVNTDSFKRFGDRNLITGTLAKSWLRKDGRDLDILAQELSVQTGMQVTEQDIVDFMLAHPSNRVSQTSDIMTRLAKKFSNIASAEMKFPVGGPESNTGRLYIRLKEAGQKVYELTEQQTREAEGAFAEDIQDNASDIAAVEESITEEYAALYDEAIGRMDEEEADRIAVEELEKEPLYEGMTAEELDDIYSSLEYQQYGTEGQRTDSEQVPAEQVQEGTGESETSENERVLPEDDSQNGAEDSGTERTEVANPEELLPESPESANERRMNQIIERLDEIEYRLSELEGKTDIFSEAEVITLNNEKDELESEYDGLRRINATSEAIQEAREEVNTSPTEAQKEAGNYKKGHVSIDGLDVSIENPKGSVRSGVDADGNAWSVTMQNDYGYIRGTKAVDGDHIDIFLSDSPAIGNVYVVDAIDQQTGAFDESKVMYGFNSMEEARDAYLSNYSEGWKVGPITEVSKEEFKKWIDSSTRKGKPFGEYKSVKSNVTDPQQLPKILKDAYESEDKASITNAETLLREYVDGQNNLKQISTTYFRSMDNLRKEKDKSSPSYKMNDFIAKTCKDALKKAGIAPDALMGEKKRMEFANATKDANVLDVMSVDPSFDVLKAVVRNPNTSNNTLQNIADNTNYSYLSDEARQILEERNSNQELANENQPNFSPNEPKETEQEEVQVESKDKFVGYKEFIDNLFEQEELILTPYKNLSEWKEKDEEFYANRYDARIDEFIKKYVSYIKELSDNGTLQRIYDHSSLKNQKVIRDNLADAGIEYKDYIDTKVNRKRIPQKADEKSDLKEGSEVNARFYDGTIVSGTIESIENNEIGIRANNGRLYNVPLNRILDNDDNVLFRDNETLDEVNERFNQELKQQIDGTLPKGHVYRLGMPSEFLQAAGIPSLPIEMPASQLAFKATSGKHDFDLGEVMNLPEAIANPIATFVYGDKEKSQNILTVLDHNGEKFLVGLFIRPTVKGEVLEVNSIRNVFPKNNDSIIKWILDGKLTNANKEKLLNFLDQQRTNHADVAFVLPDEQVKQRNSEVYHATKIVENFENPKLEETNFREGQGSQTDASISLANDPAFGIEGATRRSSKQQEEYAARERRRMENAANQMVDKLGLDNVEVVTDASTLEGRKLRAKGFYDPKTGKITIVIPNHRNSYDVEQTILHEAVAHYGLRKLFGEHFDTFLDNVYNNASAEVRKRIDALAKKYNGNLHTATEEYLASLAENTDFENAVHSDWFDKIKTFFLKMLAKVGINLPELTDNELRYILWRSYENMAHPGRYSNVFDEAADVAMQNELKVGNYAEVYSSGNAAAEGVQDTKAERIEKLRNSKPVEIAGNEVEPSDDLKQYRKNANEYGLNNLRGYYVNKDTGKSISVSKSSIKEVTSHDASPVQFQSVAAIPQILENSIFIDTAKNEDMRKHGDVSSYDYYVCGLRIGGVDYTVKAVIANGYNGEKYYDHRLTQIEKGELISLASAMQNHGSEINSPLSDIKDKRLISILQENNEKDTASDDDVLFRTSSVDELLDDWNKYVENGPQIYQISSEADIDRLPYNSFTKLELKDKLNDRWCTGAYSNRNGAIFLFPDHITGNAEELELTLWHETAHYASRQLGLDERLKNACLDYIKSRYPETYREITENYDRSRWPEEAVAHLFERKIKEFGAKKLLSSTFAGESDVAETFTQLINFIKNGKGNTESGRNSGSTGNASGENTERGVFGGRGNDLLDERRRNGGGETEGEGTTPLSSETVKAWDKLASSNRFLLRETAVDYLTAVEKFQDFIARISKKAIKDYENVYQSLLALSSRNKAEMDAFDSSIVKPLNEAIIKLVGKKKGFRKWNWDKGPLRDLVMYVYSKHGVERNRQVAVEKFIKSYQFDSFKNVMKLGVPFDMQSYVKELNEVKNKSKKDAYEKAYNKHLQKYIDKGIDEKEASEKAKKAAKKDASNAMRKASRDFQSKVKLRLESEAKELLARQWEEKKSEIGQMNVPWAEKQTMLDEEAALIGADITKDYSGLSSMFKDDKWIDLSREYVTKYENSHSSENINGLWSAIKNATDFSLYKQYKSGLVSEEYVKNQQKRFDNYIPLRGFKGEIAGDVYNYIGKEYRIGNPVKSMEGRGSEADNPFGSILQIAYSSISSGNKNTAKQRLMNLVLNHNTDNLTVVNRAWKVKEDVLDEYGDLLVVPSNKEEEQDDNDTEWVEAVAKIPEGASPKEIEKIMTRFGEAMSKLKAEGRAEEIRKGSKIAYRTLYDERSSHQIPLYVGGEKYIITITGNPRLAQAVNGELNPESKSGWLAESGQRINRTMAGLLTAKNVAFSLSNLSKDTIDANNQAFIKENPKWWWEFTKNQRAGFGLYPQMMKCLKTYNEGKMDITDKNQALFKEFMDYGGATGYTFVETQKEYAQKLSKELNKLSSSDPRMLSPKWLYDTVFNAIEFAGQSAEIVNRFAAYKTSREMGRSITRSISDAKEITVNFNRKGAGKKTAGKNTNTLINIAASISEYGRNSIIFWNANMQGKYRLYKNLKEHPVKTSTTLVGNTMTLGAILIPLLNNLVLPALYSAFGFGSDDDDVDYFDALTDWERTHNICVRLPKGDWLKVPIAPDMAPWLTMGDVIGAQVAGKREASWTDFAKCIIDATSPFSINWSYEGPAFFINFAPTISGPLLQNMTNTNFMGNPIAKKPYSNRQAFEPKFKQVYRSTSPTLIEMSRALNRVGGGDDVKASGEATNWNPAYIQNLISGYTGGYGMTFLSVADFITTTLKGESPEAAIGNFPIVSRFYISGSKDMKRSRINSSYYEVRDFIDKMKHDVKGYEDAIDKAQENGDIGKMAEYNMKKNNLMNSKEFSKLNELENLDKQIRDYEKYLKEFPEDEKVQKMVYDAKRRALEIMDEK